MNGTSRLQPPRDGSTGRYGSESSATSNDRNYISNMASTTTPNGKTILNSYRQDIVNGFEVDKPRYNPVRNSSIYGWHS